MEFPSQFQRPRPFHLLYVARHVNEDPLTARASSGQYPRYHREIRDLLRKMAGDVEVADTVVGLEDRIGRADFVFSLMNRIRMRNGEVYISALCEYTGIPYMGAAPAIRALAEDKYLAKHFVNSLGIPTAEAIPSSSALPLPRQAPFTGPYFVKPRNGAGSENISPLSWQESWAGAVAHANTLETQGLDVLVERFVEGENVTIPVIGHTEPVVLSPVVLQAESSHAIITHHAKQQSDGEMHFALLDDPDLSNDLQDAAIRIYEAIKPVDYTRIDFRVNRERRTFNFLEMNICCDISSFGSLMFSANAAGYSQEAIVSHILAHSYARQK